MTKTSALKTSKTLVVIALVVLATASSGPLKAQVLNGDFCSGVDHWVVLRMPDSVAVPGVVQGFDIDGSGPLGTSDAYVAQAGTGDQRRLQQSIFLLAGTNYHFGLDLACVPGSNNGDGGTITISIGSIPLGSFAFGGTTYGVNEYGRITGSYVPPVTGFQTLTIDISRGYFAGGGTPVNYIDNVVFAPVGLLTRAPVVSIDDVGVSQILGSTTNALFTVTLSAPSAQEVTVHYTTTNGTATAGTDFAFTNGSLTFPPGVTTQFVSVIIFEPRVSNVEPTLDFGVAIDTTCASASCAKCSGRCDITTAQLPIDEPNLSISDAIVNELDIGETNNAIFWLRLDKPGGEPIEVDFDTVDVTATGGLDYISLSGTRVFQPGETTQFIAVPVIGDRLSEPPESFKVRLSHVIGANLLTPEANGTIYDGDDLCIAGILDAGVTEIPGGSTNAVFEVHLSTSNSQPVSLSYATSGRSANSPWDYVATNGTLTFLPGVTTQFISVVVLGDLVEEPTEDFRVVLSDITNSYCGKCEGIGYITNSHVEPTLSVAITNPADGATFKAPPGLIPITAVAEFSALSPAVITFGELARDIGGQGPFVENGYEYEGVGESWSLQGGYGPEGNALLTFWGIHPALGNVITFKRIDGRTFRFLSLELRGRLEGQRNDVVKARGFLNGTEIASQVLQSSNEAWRVEFANSSFVTPVDELKFELVESNDAALIFDNLKFEAHEVGPAIVQRVDFFASPNYYLAGSTNPPFTVQWSNSIPGSYTLTAIATTASGATATSAPVHILVVLPCSGSLSAHGLANQSACACEAVVFTALASSSDPLTFLWRANGRLIPGQTQSNLVLQSLKPEQAGIYSVEISTPCKSLTNNATLTVLGGSDNPLVVSNASPITIDDLAPARPYPSTINVGCIPGPVKRVTVNLFGLSHTSAHDIDILLVNPANYGIKLMSDAGRSASNVDLTFSDGAAISLPDFASPILSGLYKPTDFGVAGDDAFPGGITYLTNLAGFNGTSPNGTWGLFVRDDESLDTGTIARGWALTIDWDDSPPRLSFPTNLSDGRFQMILKSVAGRTHVLEASTDLHFWVPFSTNTMVGTNMPITLPLESVRPHRFFRVLRCPNI